MKDKINDMVILFLDKQFKDKNYKLHTSYGITEYEMDDDLYFTYNPHIDSFETSNYLDSIILQYIPKYQAFDKKTLRLVNEWGKENFQIK